MSTLDGMSNFFEKTMKNFIYLDKTNSNEKFNKLLETYNKLREEHVVVLRRVLISFCLDFIFQNYFDLGR